MAPLPVELILFRQLATTLAVPVFLVDEHGDLVFLNEPAERLLGLQFDDIDEQAVRGLDRGAPIARPGRGRAAQRAAAARPGDP